MCLIEDQSWIDCIDMTSRWDTFVLFHLYGNKGVSLPLWPIRPRWFHTFCPCAEPLGDGYEGMWARFGSQGSIALNWHSRYSGTRYSGTWLYYRYFSMTMKPSWDSIWFFFPWYVYRNFHYVDQMVMKPCYLYSKKSRNILLRWYVYVKTTLGSFIQMIFFINTYLP